MQGIKYIFVSVLAICATQCQAEESPISAERVDLRLFVENAAAIAKNMFNAVNTGLAQSKPHMDNILNELAPEAKSLLRKVIDEAKAKIKEEENQIAYYFDTLAKALNSLKSIKTCADKVSPTAKKLALVTEKGIADSVTAIQTKYKKEIENVKVGTKKVIAKTRKLFDEEIAAMVKCLTPGRQDAGACLDKEIDKVMAGIKEVIVDIIAISQTAHDTFSPIFEELIKNLLPFLDKTIKDGRVILKTLTDCVASLK